MSSQNDQIYSGFGPKFVIRVKKHPKHIEISVVAPCYNEEENIGIFLSRLQNVLTESDISYEIIIRRRNFIQSGRNKCNDKNGNVPKWYDLSLEFHNWDLDTYGDVMRYYWRERDAGGSSFDVTYTLPAGKFKVLGQEINFGALSLKLKVDGIGNDWDLNEELVYYCEDQGKTYSTGRVLFTLD